MKLFAVRDVKSDSFSSPLTISTVGIAIRSFTEACVDPKSEYSKYPDDYMLYELGTYDPNSGHIVSLNIPKLICTAAALIQQVAIGRNPSAPVTSSKEVSA